MRKPSKYPWEIAYKHAWVTVSGADRYQMQADFERIDGFVPEHGVEALKYQLYGQIVPTPSGGILMAVEAVKDEAGNVSPLALGITPIRREKIIAVDPTDEAPRD